MMYNSKTSAGRRMRALALVPALGAAIFVTYLPAVAGAMGSASEASLSALIPADAGMQAAVETAVTVDNDKVTKNPSAGQPLSKTEADFTVNVTPESRDKLARDAADKRRNDIKMDEIVVVGYGSSKKQVASGSDGAGGKVTDSAIEKPFDVVDELPSYPGGQVEILRHIVKNIRYPKDAMEDSIQGRVVLRFIVDKDGKVTSPEILRGVCPSIDAEALRVVSTLQPFTPAKVDGKPVALWHYLPIAFRLTANSSVKSMTLSAGDNDKGGITSVKLDGDEKSIVYVVDGFRVESIRDIDPNTIESVSVWKSEDSPLYVKYKKPVVEIKLKK